MAAAKPGGELDDARAVGAEAPACTSDRANAQSLGRRARRVDGIGDIVLGRPDVCQRDPERGWLRRQAIRDGQRAERPVHREGVDRHLRPVDVLLGYERAVARRLGPRRSLPAAARCLTPASALADPGDQGLDDTRRPRLVELPRLRHPGRGEGRPLPRLVRR